MACTKRNERTLKMMENFISLRNKGHSIKEIAEKFNLSVATVYKSLDEISAKSGVSREELLERVFVADHTGRNFTPVKPIDRAKFNESFDLLMEGVDSFSDEITKAIESIDIMNASLEEKMK